MDKMNHLQKHLHSENFDLCRICLLEPESHRHIPFLHIFSPENKEIKLQKHINEILNIQISTDDICPKIICQTCLNTLLPLIDMKKKAAESQIVIKYIAKKKFGATFDESNQSTSIQSHFLSNSTKSNDLTYEKNSFSQNKSKISTNSNIHNQGTSSHSLINHSNINESDNDDDDDDDISCQELRINHDVICISDSEEEFISHEQGTSNNHKLYKSNPYCTICRKEQDPNHNCSNFNQDFSTCLVPNCNILCRSFEDFEPHYRQHIGMSSGAIMCRFCFKEKKRSECDVDGFHIHCHLDNILKCYTCNIVFKNISEFAYHKLKTHNGRLINAAGNYLCFHCEKSSPDLLNINEHITYCHENNMKNVEENENEFTHDKSYTGNLNEKMVHKKNIQGEKIPPPSNNVLFTCLKPNCNLIFQSFPVFKHHYREHFEIGHQYMCWQCCMPFSSVNILRIHQVKGNCRTPGMFKCSLCPEQFNDIQCLSIHKFTLHNGILICKNKKNILCAFCKITTDIDYFKNHLVQCQLKNDKQIESKTPERTTTVPISSVIKKSRGSSFKCEYCAKVCVTAAALSSHRKIHDPNRQKRGFKNKINNKTTQKNEHYELANITDNKETKKVINTSSSRKARGNNTNNTNHINYLTDLYICNNCPKKFHTRKGLAKHRSVCPNLKSISKKDPPKKYYCTKCKEFFTHSGFAEHYKITHGIKLISKRRYPCNKCPVLFMYKIALMMHKEYAHNEMHNTVNITDSKTVNCVNMPSEPISKNDVEELMETNEEENCNVKTEYQENMDTSLDIEVQNEESVEIELENKIEGIVNDHDITNNNDDINFENVDVCDVSTVDANNFESNDSEMNLKEQLNNVDELTANNANEVNENNTDIIPKTEFIYRKVTVNTSETEENQNSLAQPISVNGILNENETINPLTTSE